MFSALVGIVSRLGDLERLAGLIRRVELRWLFLCALLQAGTYLCEGLAWKAVLDRCGSAFRSLALLTDELRHPPPANASYDLNGDGRTDVVDARVLVTRFSRAGGAACR